MPLEFITTNQTTQYNVDDSDAVFVMPGVTMTSTDLAISSTEAILDGATLNVQGTIAARIGVYFFATTTEINNTHILIGAQGSINASSFGVLLNEGVNNSVVNYGELSAQQAAVYSQGGEIRVANHGTMTTFGEGDFGAIFFSSSTGGSNIREVVNTGVIDGTPVAFSVTPVATISNSGGAEFHLDNSGSILGGDFQAIYSAATENFITNTGLITGDMAFTTGAEMTNTGLITGDITLSGQSEMINTGIIDGDVTMSGFADTYQGIADGVITGELDLGIGDDTATLGNVGGTVRGGFGADTITGGTGADVIYGDNQNDLIRGRSGDDIIDGGTGNDTLRAGQGDDEISGGDGDDFIRGGAGEDIITGGQGLDILVGGRDADTFVFETASDSPDDNALRDIIQDFVVGEDIIDLRELGFMDYIGTGGFSGTGGAEFQVTAANSIGRVKVFIDLDGDGTADMKIVLNNTTSLSEDDFLISDPLII